MPVLPMPPRKPAYPSMTPRPAEDDPLTALASNGCAAAAGALADDMIDLIEAAMIGPPPALLPLDAIAGQVYALAMTIAASAVADEDVADTLTRATSGLRLGVARCRRTIAEDIARWPPLE
jgi:hypothetical protein